MRLRTKIIILLITLITILAAIAAIWVYLIGARSLPHLALRAVERQASVNASDRAWVEEAVGFTKPKTYLLLFLNNTELRPGGGFIGAYALVNVANGLPSIQAVEGTEHLGKGVPFTLIENAPVQLAKYLKVANWYFRDSNWSPDFAESSAFALKLFTAERFATSAIDAVIGFTPTVVEEFLKITGPVEAGGKIYDSKNFTEQLEYEVEFAYKEKGIPFNKRKAVLLELGRAISGRLVSNAWRRWPDYLALLEAMRAQKQIAVYAANPDEERNWQARGWAAPMRTSTGDYLLWADANLGALKTDAAIIRSLFYRVTTSSKGYLATAEMTYRHDGKFDWRTTRYRNFARVFVPRGSRLISTVGAVPDSLASGTVKLPSGAERDWFGGYLVVEPGDTRAISFSYLLPPAVSNQIKSGNYRLLAQKQIGTIAVPLTVSLDFDKFVSTTLPIEGIATVNDSFYRAQTNLREDKELGVKLKQ